MNHIPLNDDFIVPTLGDRKIFSPLKLSRKVGDGVYDYIKEGDRVVYDNTLSSFLDHKSKDNVPLSFEKAGPHEHIYFEPAKTKVAIVTCGGLCPGLNNVIRALVMQLNYRYKVNRIFGIRYGYAGFIPEYNLPTLELNTDVVDSIHTHGGTILGSSRGKQDISEIVDSLERMNINILFAIGGDGTMRGLQAIYEEISRRQLKIAVAGIPKTIDNDINFIEKSFGFETAVAKATEIIRDAHNEAKGAYNGIAIVKLMGRESGFIAADAALSIPDANFVLIPEMKFDLHGPNGFLKILRTRLEVKQHALIVVAEGAGQDFFENNDNKKDSSGNKKLKDIGLFLKEKISEDFNHRKFPFTLKYIDPSYIIRSAPANANDSKFCIQLAQNAVHGAMAGRTGFVVGNWNSHFTFLPITLAVKERKRINLEGELWYNVLEVTGQPVKMEN
jgi:6-phosphofructokinase 1